MVFYKDIGSYLAMRSGCTCQFHRTWCSILDECVIVELKGILKILDRLHNREMFYIASASANECLEKCDSLNKRLLISLVDTCVLLHKEKN